MTTFVSNHFSFVTPNGGNSYTIQAVYGSFTVTDNNAGDNQFTTGEQVNVGGFGEMFTVRGHFGVGVLVQNNVSLDRYFLSLENYAPNDTFTAQTDPFTICFLTGTMIATPEGERAVETLAAGDLVLTADSETRPVRWMGHQTIRRLFADPLRNYPVRIAAGALGENVPHRDLFVSPDHAMLVDGVLANAAALVNGTSITRVAAIDETIVYHHIELEDHALVLAEGAAAETFVDSITRKTFDNYAEYEALFGEEQPGIIAEHDLPRALSARQLPPALRARLQHRAEVLGFVESIAA